MRRPCASCAAAFESFWGQSSVVTLKKQTRRVKSISATRGAGNAAGTGYAGRPLYAALLFGRLGRSGPAGRCVCGLCRPDAADVAYPDRLLRRGFFTLPVTPAPGLKRRRRSCTDIFYTSRQASWHLRFAIRNRKAFSPRRVEPAKTGQNFTFLSCFVAPKPVCTV